jgi:hypothetical protein
MPGTRGGDERSAMSVQRSGDGARRARGPPPNDTMPVALRATGIEPTPLGPDRCSPGDRARDYRACSSSAASTTASAVTPSSSYSRW